MGFTPEQIKGRIKSVAKQNNADARTLMRIYMMERFLERLAQSEYRDNFIIKGGILVTAMIGVAHRSTMDIDTSMKNLNLSAEDLLQLILLLVLEMHIFLLKKDLMRFTRKLRFHSTTFSLWDLVVASELWALQKRSFRSSLDRDTIKWLDCYISFRPSLLLSALVIAWVRSTTRHAESEKRVQTT